MKYKILAALLAAITATTLCGCGESEKQDETTTVQASTQATTQAKTTAATTKAAPNTEAEASNVTQAEAETDAQAQPQEETAAETEAQSSQSAMTREVNVLPVDRRRPVCRRGGASGRHPLDQRHDNDLLGRLLPPYGDGWPGWFGGESVRTC